ncbi:MAG: hypothetical protein HYY30_11480 [Chloroflexi bacterium]|nr:hypothetical protein [Chloroflexota bacterium]
MSGISDLFVENIVFIFFIYGLSFFALGFTLLLQSLSPIRLAGLNHLWLLAVFGLLHGAHEWLVMGVLIASSIPGRGNSLGPMVNLELPLLLVSFTALLQFGGSTLVDRRRWWRGLHAASLVLLAIIVAFLLAIASAVGGVRSSAWIETGQIVARYGLGLTGSLLTGWVFWQIGRSWPRMEASRVTALFTGAAISFFLYGVLAGLVGPPAPFFPASILNTVTFLATFGIPVQAVRALCAISVTYFLIRLYFLEAARYMTTAYEAEKRTVRELQDLDRLKNEFISFVSHEFRQPLSVIKGWAQYLLRPSSASLQDESVRRALDAIYRQASRLTDLVENVLNVSRIETGALPFNPRAIRLADIIDAVAEDMSVQAQARGIKIEVRVDKAVEAYADPDLTRQILVNLVSNAIKYTFENTTVFVRARAEDGVALVSVRDQGQGIPPDQLSRLFGRFVRLARPGELGQPGAGLGLYITRRLVEMQGGKIWVESEPGKGSTFYFTLPGDGRLTKT